MEDSKTRNRDQSLILAFVLVCMLLTLVEIATNVAREVLRIWLE